MKDEFEISFCQESVIKFFIDDCQKKKHIQQVAFSTYHNCLTQICFSCKKIRTTMNKKDYALSQQEVTK